MEELNNISDEEFVPFLDSLGVDTYKKSFEWMLNDPDFSGVLRWLYNNLDQNNALTAREEYRYSAIVKNNKTLTVDELEVAVSRLQQEYEGICLPGDQEAMADITCDVEMKAERLAFLEKQEVLVKNMLQQNELSREELTQCITKLHSAQQQYEDDERTISEQCVTLSEEIETIMEGVIDVVADKLNVFRNACNNKEIANKFFTFGPLESYRHTQALFRSHFDLFTAKKFTRKHDSITDKDLRAALFEAKNMEERLLDTVKEYIESKADYAGEQAKLALVSHYNNVHPSQITLHLVESQSAVELLKQEEGILEQTLDGAVKEFVDEQTKLAVDTTALAALAAREEIHSSLKHLLETTNTALSLDRLVYCALRHELRTLEEVLQFAFQLKEYVVQEEKAQWSRIESMNEISNEHELCEQKLQSTDLLLNTLHTLFGVQPTNDGLFLVKLYNDLIANIRELKDSVTEGYKKKEESIVAYKSSTAPIVSYVYDGCTKAANCSDRGVAGLMHELRHCVLRTEGEVAEASGLFAAVKNGDKNNLRKLWQWFLTDQGKLISQLKGTH